MRIALIGDLHGNMPAVMAVDADIARRSVDAVYCLGDMVGKGPRPAEAMDWAMDRCDVVLMGNWDEAVLDARFPGASWARRRLGESRLARLRALPMEHRFTLSGRKVRLVHGRPVTPDLVYADSPLETRQRLFETDDGYGPNIVGFADIHYPFYEQINRLGTLLNIGSVGNPLAWQPYPAYAILEGEPGEARCPLAHTIIQIEYDREEAARQAESTPGLPQKDAYVLELFSGQYSR